MPNDVLKCIKSRRSIRAYRPDQITEQELQAVLEAGLYAPSAMNQQSWHFTVIQNRALLQQMSEETKAHLLNSGFPRYRLLLTNPEYSVFHHAPTAVIISGVEDAIDPRADCAAAAQNMLLAAESLHLGSCWVNMPIYLFRAENGPEWEKRLGIPSGYKPLYGVVLGYKTDKPAKTHPRKENTINYIR